MSLISLSSSTINDPQQKPFDFKNHFPQPIIIKPHSSVALVNFYHYRDDEYYRIHRANRIIAYAIGDANLVGYRYATLTIGRYETGDLLAFEMQRALNASRVQQNYTFTVAFTAGNPQANPITLDSFTISYAHVPAPTTRGGSWSKLTGQTGNLLTIVNRDEDNQVSEITTAGITEANRGKSCMMRRGIITHEGSFRITGIGKLGSDDAGNFFENKLHNTTFGIVRKQFSELGNELSTADFNRNFADILVRVETNPANGHHSINISTLKQRRGTTSILAVNGKHQFLRRTFTDAFVDAVYNDQEKLGFEILLNSSNRSFIVRLLISSDNGATYTPVPDGAGDTANNADGGVNVYTQTINGVQVGGIIYSTAGVPIAGGGGMVADTTTVNRAQPKYAPFIPFVSPDELQQHPTAYNFDNIDFTTINAGAGANNQFTINIDADDAGMHADYDYSTGITTPEGAAGTVVSANFDELGLKQKAGDIYTLEIYPNKANPLDPAQKLGEMTFKVEPEATFGLNGGFVITGFAVDPLNVQNDTLPAPTLIPAKLQLSGVFNHTLINSYSDINGELQTNISNNHNEANHEDGFSAVHSVRVGADLTASSTFLLNRLQQADINGRGGAPTRFVADMKSGNLGSTIGFRDNFITNNAQTLSITSNDAPIKLKTDNNIHISIPELGNVGSYEGEAQTTGKTIKVIPKNEFKSDDSTGALTFISNYEDYIDLNNGETLVLNELSLQVRNPDNTMATELQPITRATIKIKQGGSDSEKHKEEERIMKLARIMSQQQSNQTVSSLENRAINYSGS